MKFYRNGNYIKLDNFQTEAPAVPYEDRVVDRIREKYSINDELAILRQRDTKRDEFVEYHAFVEQIKEEERQKS